MSKSALPTVLIGGYLGAGKTTLVNHLLRHAAGRRVAVLVNDFGSINIDAELIDAAGSDASADVLALSGGCLCCSFGDDLVGTLNGLAQRSPPPDVCVVELSGVALPAAVWRTARLAQGIAPVGTLVLADAAEIRRQADDRYVGDTVRQQLQDADWLLLNKPDLVDEAALQATLQWLPTLAPQARCWAGAAGSLPADLVLGWPADEGPAPHKAAAAGDAAAGAQALERLAGRPIGPRPAAAQSVFDSHSLALPAGVDLAALGAALSQPDSGVLRAKGLAVDAQGQGQLLQVAGGRWALTPATVQGVGRLVLIGLRERWDPQALLQPLLGGRPASPAADEPAMGPMAADRR